MTNALALQQNKNIHEISICNLKMIST